MGIETTSVHRAHAALCLLLTGAEPRKNLMAAPSSPLPPVAQPHGFAFLSGYDQHSLWAKGSKKHRRWDPPPWLEERLSDAGQATSREDTPWARNRARRIANSARAEGSALIVALVMLVPLACAASSGLHKWGKESQFLFTFLGMPPDGHAFRVAECYLLETPIEVFFQASATASGGMKRLPGPQSSMVFFPGDLDAGSVKVLRPSGDGFLLCKDIVSGGGSVPCLRQPVPVVELVIRSRWHEVLIAARFFMPLREQGGPQARKRKRWDLIAKGFPETDWTLREVEAVNGDEVLPDHADTMSANALNDICNDLRAWSGHIIAASPDASAGAVECLVASHHRNLCRWRDILARKEVRVDGTCRASATTILQTFRASRLLSDKMGFSLAFRRCLDAALPGLVDHASLSPPLKKSALGRAGLIVDTACVIREQWRNSPAPGKQSPPFLRFGWSDSSPIHGRDWFIAKHIRIPSDMLLDVFDATQRLTADRWSLAHQVQRSRKRKRRLAGIVDEESDNEDFDLGLHDVPAGGLSVATRQSLCKVVAANVRLHIHVPTAVGQRAADVAHKCSALAHSVGVECASESDLKLWFRGVVSWCTDMGTEMGQVDFRGRAASLLPSWWRWPRPFEADRADSDGSEDPLATPIAGIAVPKQGRLAFDQGEGDGDPMECSDPVSEPPAVSLEFDAEMEEEPSPASRPGSPRAPSVASPASPAPAVAVASESGSSDSDTSTGTLEQESCGGPRFMPRALYVPGMLHVLHNLCWDVTESMSYWGTFWSQLKNAAALLAHPDMLRRLAATCIMGSRQEHARELFSKACPELYEKRWGAVYAFMKSARAPLLVLRLAWQQSAFVAGGNAAGQDGNAKSNFDPEAFTRTLSSNMFFAYLDMCLAVNKFVWSIAGWCEGCSCHEPLLVGTVSAHVRRTRLVADYGEGVKTCPLASMRFPELVVAGFSAVCAGTFAESSAQLMADVAVWVTAGEWQVVLSDFQAAFERFQLVLRVKTDFLNKLPWLLGGLAHHDSAVQREYAQRCLRAFDETPEAFRPRLHRLAKTFLKPGSKMRRDIEKLAAGKEWAELGNRRRKAIAALRFVCLAERIIEAGHKDIKAPSGFHRCGPCSASLYVRTTTVLEGNLFHGGAEEFREYVAAVDATRHIRSAIQQVHCFLHPLFDELREASLAKQETQTTKYLKYLAQVLYRCDLQSMFDRSGGIGRERQGHERHRLLESRDEARLLQPKKTLPALSDSFLEHFRGKLHHGAILSFPKEVGNVSTLSSALGRPRARGEATAEESFRAPWETDDHPQVDGRVLPEQFSFLEGHVFAKVAHTNPKAAWKTIPLGACSGGRLSAHHVALVPLELVGCSAGGPLLVAPPSVEIALISPPSSDQLDSLGEGTDDVFLWPLTKSDSVLHSFAHLHCCGLSDVSVEVGAMITQLLGRQAVPGSATGWIVPTSSPQSQTLSKLEEYGLLSASDGDDASKRVWQLTRKGMDSLTTMWHCSSPRQSLTSARLDLPLEDRSTFQLLRQLNASAWIQKGLPSDSMKQAMLRPYLPGDRKVYRVGGRPSVLYLRCLLSAEHLVDAYCNDGIPHGQRDQVYRCLLNGERKWSEMRESVVQQILKRRAQARRAGASRALALALDVCDGGEQGEGDDGPGEPVAPPPLADAAAMPLDVDGEADSASDGKVEPKVGGGQVGLDHSPDGRSDEDDSDDGGHGAGGEGGDRPPPPPGLPHTRPPPKAMPPLPPPPLQEPPPPRLPHIRPPPKVMPPLPPPPLQEPQEPGRPEPELPPKPRARRQKGAPPPTGDPEDVVAAHELAIALIAGARWGPFAFSVKQAGTANGGVFGGVQAECPFHMRDAEKKSKCRRFIGCQGNTAEHRHEMMMRLRYWCAQARTYERQWQHVFECSVTPRPSDAEIDAMMITDGPSGPIIDDATFYRENKAAERGRGRGRGRTAVAGTDGRVGVGGGDGHGGGRAGGSRGAGGRVAGRGAGRGRGRGRAAASAVGDSGSVGSSSSSSDSSSSSSSSSSSDDAD